MKQVKYEVFEPSDAPQPTTAVAMGNILGGSLEGDHGYRAQYMANELGVFVVAYERVGTGKRVFDLGAHSAVQPNHYIGNAARTGSLLHRVIDGLGVDTSMIFGASAAATDAIVMTYTDAIHPDALALYDPVGVRTAGWREGFTDWLHHQQLEGQRPEEARNHNPMEPKPQPWATLDAVKSLVRIAPEMAYYGNVWRSDIALRGLARLLSDERYDDIVINAVFPGKTFTAENGNADIIEKIFGQMTTRGAVDRASAQFAHLAGRYHSWTDDPANVAELTKETLNLIR